MYFKRRADASVVRVWCRPSTEAVQSGAFDEKRKRMWMKTAMGS